MHNVNCLYCRCAISGKYNYRNKGWLLVLTYSLNWTGTYALAYLFVHSNTQTEVMCFQWNRINSLRRNAHMSVEWPFFVHWLSVVHTNSQIFPGYIFLLGTAVATDMGHQLNSEVISSSLLSKLRTIIVKNKIVREKTRSHKSLFQNSWILTRFDEIRKYSDIS